MTAIDTGYDLGIEKSREMGASWMVLYVFLWFWLFRANSNFRVGSRKEDFVDKIGVMDTLLEKIRFALRFLPSWMQPDGYKEKEHASYMRIVNPANGNVIVGESANPHFGSGGRSKAILLDEFAKWDKGVDEAAWTSTADVTKCRIPISTPVGSGNKYAQLMLGTAEKIKKLTLHWTLHPDKAKGAYYLDGEGKKNLIKDHKSAFDIWNKCRQQKEKGAVIVRSPWYDAECERRKESDIAQELDIDYLKSGAPFYSIAAINRQKSWKPMIRQNPFSSIPYGFYVQGKVVKSDLKYGFIENQQDVWLNIYELPKPYMEYILCGDTSEGLAKGDWSFATIRDKYTHNVVAVIKGLYEPDTFEEYCSLSAFYYNDALCAVEAYPSAYGYVVNKGLNRRGNKMYYSKKYETKEGDVETARLGVTMDSKFRPLMLTKSEEAIRRNTCEVRDEDILAQMRTFVRNPKKGGRPEADGQMHDDGVIAFSIFEVVLEENPFKPRQSSDSMTRAEVDVIKHQQKNAGFGY